MCSPLDYYGGVGGVKRWLTRVIEVAYQLMTSSLILSVGVITKVNQGPLKKFRREILPMIQKLTLDMWHRESRVLDINHSVGE